MGNPASSIVANIFMESFEEEALSNNPVPLKYYTRYVDDTLVIIREEHVDIFTNHLNNINRNI
jgi:hypothetical protein